MNIQDPAPQPAWPPAVRLRSPGMCVKSIAGHPEAGSECLDNGIPVGRLIVGQHGEGDFVLEVRGTEGMEWLGLLISAALIEQARMSMYVLPGRAA